MLGLGGMAKKKMDEAMRQEESYAKEGFELVLRAGVRVEDSDCDIHLALLKVYYLHPVARIHVHISNKETTYELESNCREDLRAVPPESRRDVVMGIIDTQLKHVMRIKDMELEMEQGGKDGKGKGDGGAKGK